MARVTVTPSWTRVDNGLGMTAGKYRLQPEGSVMLALGTTAPDDDDAVLYRGGAAQHGHPATYAFTLVTGSAGRLWAKSVSAPTGLRAVSAASFEPF